MGKNKVQLLMSEYQDNKELVSSASYPVKVGGTSLRR